MIKDHGILVHIATDFTGSENKLRSILNKIRERGEIISISSIYKRSPVGSKIESDTQVELVIHVYTTMSVDQCLHLIVSLTEEVTLGFSIKSNSKLTLLAYDALIMMSPRLTLPYPDLHNDPIIARCASEVWPTYEHPILQKTLAEISRNALATIGVEFHAQGKSLIDF